MKIALVHDVLNQLGGAEKVLDSFLEIWPDAVIHTVFYDEQKTESRYAKFKKILSGLNNFPFTHKHPRLFLVAIPIAFERFDFSNYDIVISDSSAFAKFAKTDKFHISYIHTPTRFLWTEPEYLEKQNYPYIFKLAGKVVLPVLKKWDYKAAQMPNFLLTNSRNVQSRIKKIYNRDSEVIAPPVDCDFYHPQGQKGDYFFTASRLEPYKRIDLIIDAFNELGWPLKVAGVGTIMNQLKAKAKSNIEFIGRVSDETLRQHYSACKAYVFAANEDAGIMLVEAQACGTPVIAYGAGGALETIIPGKTGEFFNEQTAASLINVLQNFDVSKFNSQEIRQHALQFDKKSFQLKILNFVTQKFQEFNTQNSEGKNL